MKITLSHGALSALIECLSLDGWAKGHQMVYRAGRLLVEGLPKIESPILTTRSSAEEIAAVRRWQKEQAPEFELSEDDASLCRDCLKKLTDAERLRPSEWVFELLNAVNLKP